MLTYDLTQRQKENLYEFFYRCIKNDIISGKLMPDTKLPSKRIFANNHGVSIVTVENTYSQLMAEGYIYSKPKSGFYVSEIITHKIQPMDSLVNHIQPEVPVVHKNHQGTINLVSNHTAADNFPFSIWAKLMRQILSEQDSRLLSTPPTGGVTALREAIAMHLRDFRGIQCSPEQIIVGAGTEYLYGLIVQLLGRNQVYGLENPGSKKIQNIYKALDAKVVTLSMDQEGIALDPDNLKDVSIVQISPSHHFPTGIVTSVSRRYGLLAWANEAENRYIIEDDYDSEFRLQGKPIPSLCSMDTTDKVIYFNTFTKSLASTIRISYMVLPQHLLERFYANLGFYSCTVSNFEQYTLARFIGEQHFEKHINRMRNHYRGLRDLLIDEIKKSALRKMVEITEEDSGLHFLLHIRTSETEETLKNRAREEGVTVAFLSEYYSQNNEMEQKRGRNYRNTAIINYSGLGEQDVVKTVNALERAWSNL